LLKRVSAAMTPSNPERKVGEGAAEAADCVGVIMHKQMTRAAKPVNLDP
jgi:hypothetical protein